MNSIARRRFARQHLIAPRLRSAVEIVRVLGAVQAQDYPNAKWAIGQRSKGLRDADIEQAFARGELLRTHVLRPTWHFVLPEDVRWMLELTGPRLKASLASYDRKLGLDAPAFRKSRAILERVLRDGQQLTRTELRTAFRRGGLRVPSGNHAGNLLIRAELDRVVISGARRGKQFTYALFDERVPPPAAPPRERDEALGALASRYFATRSPATVHDFSWWSGLAMGDARRAIEIAGRALAHEVFDGRKYHSARHTPRAARSVRIAHFLPNYDEYFIGFKDRSAFAERLGGVATKTQLDALWGHVLFVDGQIVGGWRRAPDASDVLLRLLVRLTAVERELVLQAGRRFAKFLGIPVHVDFGRSRSMPP
ncbi:MAG TPA: winged helix DNA-binding domain-containing protein [Gemmatimonadales bacterium]|nr:winged helix DNA-binding domain-containing protein [Gemmatimonadales bacterium]